MKKTLAEYLEGIRITKVDSIKTGPAPQEVIEEMKAFIKTLKVKIPKVYYDTKRQEIDIFMGFVKNGIDNDKWFGDLDDEFAKFKSKFSKYVKSIEISADGTTTTSVRLN
jgi:hypothetical protein